MSSQAFPCGFPKIGIFWGDFTQKLKFQAKYLDFSRPLASEIPHKNALKYLKMREIPIFTKSQ